MQVISINNHYASGMRRLGAFLIDRIVISISLTILFRVFLGWAFTYPFEGNWDFFWSDGCMWSWITWHNLLREGINIVYYSLMESSKYQGTLGKIVLGIRVTGLNNERVSLSTALLRNLSKILSGLILGIGYLMIIFDSRKQGLHDKIADTLIVRQ
ncbi:MAG: RDD family protein [Bacteroidetes bacterium]|nr:RDD family protein [Bacteroidota bacterium]